MPTGRVKYYNSDKGYGFIAQDTGEGDIFFHISAIQDGYDEIHVGQHVRYEVAVGDRGPVAQNVQILLTPLEQKRLRQGKVVIPRNYIPPQQSRDSSENRALASSQSPTPATPVAFSTRSVKTATSELIDSSPDRKSASLHTSKPEAAAAPDEQPTFGDLYIQKQIRLQTPMFFGLYNHTLLPVTVTGFTKYDFVLQVALNPDAIGGEIEKQELPKTDVKYCYKAEDATDIQSIIHYNEEIKEQDLKPVIQRKKRYSINTRTIVQARRDQHTIEVTMLEGEVFRGLVDWVSRYEIKMILENESKIVVFRHAICNFKVFSSEEQVDNQNAAGNDQQTIHENAEGEGIRQ